MLVVMNTTADDKIDNLKINTNMKCKIICLTNTQQTCIQLMYNESITHITVTNTIVNIIEQRSV